MAGGGGGRGGGGAIAAAAAAAHAGADAPAHGASAIQQDFAAFRATLDAGAAASAGTRALAALVSAKRAPLYKLVDGKPEQVMVRIGASDGSRTEVSGDDQGRATWSSPASAPRNERAAISRARRR